MMAAALPEERLLIEFLASTGFREQEAMYAYYTDIDFESGLIYIREKREHKFFVKDREEGLVPLPDGLVK